MRLVMNKTIRRKKFHGFVLKPGFWYGKVEKENQLVVTNGMRRGDMIALYFYRGNYNWERVWVPREDIDVVFIHKNENICAFNDKIMSFNQWAEDVYGMDQIEKDLSCPDCDPSLIVREYLRFARKEKIKLHAL